MGEDGAGSAVQQARRDRVLIEDAARRLRRDAVTAGYAGLSGQHRVFALALVLDELARHVRDLDGRLRDQVTTAACTITDPDG